MANKKAGLAMLLAVSAVAAACSGNGDTQPSAAPTASGNEGTTGKEGTKRETLKIYTGQEVSKTTYPRPSLVQKVIQDKFNVQFEPFVTWTNPDTESKLSVLFASNNYPELLIHANNQDYVQKLGTQGFLLPISDHLDKIPNYRKLWTDAEWAQVMKQAGNPDGKLYYLPLKNYRTHSIAWIYRQDTFKQLGLQFPKTTDELYEVLKAIKKAYPDSIPMTNRSGLNGVLGGLATAFRTGLDIFPDPDLKDEIVYAPMTDKYRQTLIFAHKLYKENLIEKEFATITYDQWLERHYTNKAFIESSYGTRAYSFNNESVDIPGVDWQWSKVPVGSANGPGLVHRENPFHPHGPVLTNKLKGEKLDRVLEYINWAVTDEGSLLHEFGIEGQTYVMDKGVPKYVDSLQNAPDRNDQLLEKGIVYFLKRNPLMLENSPETKIDLEVSAAFANMQNPKLLVYNWNESLSKQRSSLATDINDIREQYSVKFVMGQLDPNNDTHWNNYISELKKANVEKFVEIHKQALAN